MKRGLFFILICLGCLLCLNGCGKGTSKEKIQITFSSYVPSQWDAITMFNATNDTYEIVCEPYLEKMDDYEQYEDYWEPFMTPQVRQIPNEVTGGYIEEYEMYYVRKDGEVVHCLSEGDRERMEDLIERSTTFVWDMDIAGYNIIYEEASSYYSGQKSIDEVMELIENRIKLYLAEKE